MPPPTGSRARTANRADVYLAIKHIHVTAVIISITGFCLRGLLMMLDSPLRRAGWLKWAPHVNDTVLLGAGLTMAAMSGQYPFVAPWLTAKVFGLLAYIALGSIALKRGRTMRIRVVAWLASLATFGYVVSAALTRSPLGFMNWI